MLPFAPAAPVGAPPPEVTTLPDPVNGDALRKLRLERRVSLQDISAWSKVGVRFLDYIEADRYELLPARVYLRSFLIEYARALALDPGPDGRRVHRPDTQTRQVGVARRALRRYNTRTYEQACNCCREALSQLQCARNSHHREHTPCKGGYPLRVIYCVVPRELEHELLDQMREYYRDNPGVEVIVDRRYGGPNDRRRGETGVTDERRVTRDRRRARAIGTFPRIEAFDTADS